MTRKKLLKRFIITFGVLLLVYTVIMAFVTNLNTGVMALGIFSIVIVVYGAKLSKAKKWVHVAVIAFCSIIVVFSAFLASYGSNDNVRFDEDAVIVLGAGIRGEAPSPALAHRLDRAVEYHHRNPDAVFVVSGGQGFQEAITEALAMERYLIENGVPAGQIFKEEKSTSTIENFSFSDDILRREFPQGYSAAFITNGFHVYRADRIARDAGVEATHFGAVTTWYAVPVNYAREMIATTFYWVFR